jgi:flagellar basal body P-ring formation protein FlgA
VKVEIVALVDDQAVRSVTVLADVRRRGPALVATRDLRPGASIAPEDVRVETRDLALLPSETLAEPTLAVGAVVARRVGAGMPLSSFDLKAKPVVFRGDEVEIRFEAGGLVVRGYGRALSDGAVGDRVEVLRAGERKPVEGRVVDARRVDVSPVSFKENRP